MISANSERAAIVEVTGAAAVNIFAVNGTHGTQK